MHPAPAPPGSPQLPLHIQVLPEEDPSQSLSEEQPPLLPHIPELQLRLPAQSLSQLQLAPMPPDVPQIPLHIQLLPDEESSQSLSEVQLSLHALSSHTPLPSTMVHTAKGMVMD
jgi:hypothetical protein